MILVFGKTGQVAIELSKFDDVHCVGRDEADLMDPSACAQLIKSQPWDAVMNAAAYTAVDKAESEEDIANIINGDAPKEMARACAEKNIPFVHISTDYVFEGSGSALWKPDDQTNPQNAYGRSKLKGEQGVIAAGGNYAILRTSWVFSAHGNNFLKTMLRLGAERDQLNIVADQIGGPTPARAIAQACHTIAHQLKAAPNKSGIYHFAGTPNCSWADFAREIFKVANVNCVVNDIDTSAYPTPAVRPLNSGMSCETLLQNFDIETPSWQDAIKEVLNET